MGICVVSSLLEVTVVVVATEVSVLLDSVELLVSVLAVMLGT